MRKKLLASMFLLCLAVSSVFANGSSEATSAKNKPMELTFFFPVNVGGAVSLSAAIDYINSIGFDAIQKREDRLTALAFDEMKKIPCVDIIGSQSPEEHHGIIAFTVEGVHPHDIAAIFDSENIAVRAGHHCAQPLHHFLGVQSTTRMSAAFYNDEKDILRFIEVLKTIRRRMGYGG